MAPSPEPAPAQAQEAAEAQTGLVWDGRYQVERTLGEGGMGEVWLARDLARDGRAVALKVLQARFREVATPYFMREFVMQRKLRHPGIARVHELGFDHQEGSEVPYFAMQFVSGVPLALLFDEPIELEDVWRWAIEILQALDLVHRSGYLHRDVKPGNILVDVRAGASRSSACLIDFGIAIPLGAEKEDFFIGTPEYSAPERMSCESLDPRSDLYSVGLILYELIEGEAPWPGWEPEELWIQRMKRPPPPIKNPACPPAVRELLYDALKPDPADRPQSAVDFIDRLCRALGRPAVLETDTAFQHRLAAMVPATPSYREALEAQGRLVVFEVPPGHDGAAILHEVADGQSVKGVRVVRVQLDGRPSYPLAELEPALDVFRRLRAAKSGQSPLAILQGIAGAATMLTRMHRETVLCIEGLQRADAAIVTLLQTVFTGASNDNLTVLATVDAGEAPLTGELFRNLLAQPFVKRQRLAPLTREDTAAFIASAVGLRVLDDARIDRFHEESGGAPVRLVQLLAEAYRKGDLRRHLTGYRWLEAARGPDTRNGRFLAADLPLFEHLAVLRGPLPTEVVQAFLGDAWAVEDLIASGLLARVGDGRVAATSRAILDRRYQDMAQLRRRALHQRLADTLGALDPFPCRAAIIADQLEATARAAQAVPYLLTAAAEAADDHHDARVVALVDRAASLAEDDPLDDDDRWHWRILIAEAEIDVGRRLGDLARLATAAERLFRLGVDGAHLSSIEHALVAKMDHAHALGDWGRLVDHGEQLLLLHHSAANGRAVALHRWARAMAAWADRDVESALQLVADGLAAGERADVQARLKLLVLRAELALAAGLGELLPKALGALREAGAREADRLAVARARLIEAVWLRRAGRVSAALKMVQESTADVGAAHGRGINGRIELEFAECHLALGWHESALEHARRAIELARRDHDDATAFAARSALAEALLVAGEHVVAHKALERALIERPPHAMPQVVNEARWRLLLCRFERGESSLPLVRAMGELAGEAAQHSDPTSAMRAGALAVRACLRLRRGADAVRYAEWLAEMAEEHPVSGVPRHAIDWLLGSAHYQLRWFQSAASLTRRAMEGLREATQAWIDPEHRRGFMAARDNALVGSDVFATAPEVRPEPTPERHPEVAAWGQPATGSSKRPALGTPSRKAGLTRGLPVGPASRGGRGLGDRAGASAARGGRA